MSSRLPIWLFCAFIILACNSKPKERTYTPEEQVRIAEMKDSLVNSVMSNAMKSDLDTGSISNSPIKILNAKLFKEEYSSYKSISLSYKNVSGKKVEAIKFKWYGEDAFGKPADMGAGSIVEGYGGGFDDDPLGPGKSRTSQWSIYSSRGKKVILAWAYEVAFSDGTSWKSSK